MNTDVDTLNVVADAVQDVIEALKDNPEKNSVYLTIYKRHEKTMIERLKSMGFKTKQLPQLATDKKDATYLEVFRGKNDLEF